MRYSMIYRTLLILAVIIASMPLALAEGESVNVGTFTVEVGSSVSVPIMVGNADLIAGGSAKVIFDPTIVNVVGITGGDFFETPTYNADNTAGFIYFAGAGSNHSGINSGVFATIQFEGVAVGTTDLSFESISLNLENGSLITPTSSTGSITTNSVTSGVPVLVHQYHWYGDYDGNGVINRLDGLVIGVIVSDSQGLDDITSVTVDGTQLGLSSTLQLRKNPGSSWSDAHYMEALDLAALNIVATSGTIQLPVTITDSSGHIGAGEISITIKDDIAPTIIHSVSWADAGGNCVFIAYPWDIGTSHIESVKLDASQIGLWDDLAMSFDAGWGGYLLWVPVTAGTLSETPSGTYALNVDIMDTSGYSGTGTLDFVKS